VRILLIRRSGQRGLKRITITIEIGCCSTLTIIGNGKNVTDVITVAIKKNGAMNIERMLTAI